MTEERDDPRKGNDNDAHGARGRDESDESSPTESGHSTANDQANRNQEDESPS